MKNLDIQYSQRDNIGDAINPLILHNVFGFNARHAGVYKCSSTGIGSGMGRFCYVKENQNFINLLKKEVAKLYYTKPLMIWSTGFIREPDGNLIFRRKNVITACVRGKKTKSYMQKILKNDLVECKTGDGGILACELIKKTNTKKYSIGIIPHDSEREEVCFAKMQAKIKNSVIIDVRGDVIERLKTISQCETIISSSLHGLIISDSFNIPNRQFVLTDRLDGDGFKFKDYYSNFDLENSPLNLNNCTDISQYDIIDNYKIKANQIDQMKKDVYCSFLNSVEKIANE